RDERPEPTLRPLPVAPAGETPAPSEPTHPGFLAGHRRPVLTAVGFLAIAGFVYFVIPQIAGLGPTLRRLRSGDVWWLALGVLLEAVSIGGQVALFRGVFTRPGNRVGWDVSYEITLAGGAATKIFATAGAGGIALTVWALRAAGLPAAEVATGMVCYEILTYGVYMAALAIFGFGLWFGVFTGTAPIGVTLMPALFGLAVITIVVSMLYIDVPTERWLRRRARASHGRAQRRWQRAAALPRSLQAGLRAALAMVRRRDPAVLWPLVAWGFDIGTLWAAFQAFGHAPPPAELVMGYYVGTLANTLPLPGGIGGVEGGMIGSFLAFGVNGSLAVLAVLAYRTISYWLPTVPGAIAYIRLRRRAATWGQHEPATALPEPPRVLGGQDDSAVARSPA
ncbi:MAG: flippase-like domain-containing protein, partial [Solirubrobacterales bacterium]|nr:flippase-like domain-containing protein [Solirubrobacterales bacterium]